MTEIADGFGTSWVKCGPDCDLHVVRPGKAQCHRTDPGCLDHDGHTICLGGPPRIIEGETP